MSALILPSRFTQQPQQGAQVDWSNPLTRGLSDIWLPTGGPRTLVRGEATSTVGTVISGVGAAGQFVRGNGSSTLSGVQIASNSSNLLNNLNTTWFVVRRCRDTTVRSSYMSYGYDAGASNRAFLGAPDGSNITWDFGNATAGSGRLQAAYTKDTQLETLVVVAGQTKGREIWRRGVKLAANTTARAGRNADANAFGIGPIGNNTPFDDIETYVFGVVNREWSDAEIVNWCANPWQVFKAPDANLWLPLVSGSSGQASPSGVAAISAAGAVTPTGTASASPTGVSATSSVGTATASGTTTVSGNATPAGVSATSNVGTPAASGYALATPIGAAATSAVGQAVASGPQNGAATPAGVSAVGDIGQAKASTGDAIQLLGGGGDWKHAFPSKTKRQQEIEDELLGILPEPVAEIVKQVAESAKPQRDLKAELKRAEIAYKAAYAQILAKYADFARVERETQRRLEQLQREEDEEIAVLLLM